GDGHVDMKDFRRLRDAALPGIRHFAGADMSNPKLDLNMNGRVESGGIYPLAYETYPRQALSADIVEGDFWVSGQSKLTSLDLLRKVYVPSADEPWREQDLPHLMYSADLHFFKNDIKEVIHRLHASGIEIIEIGGDVAPARTAPSDLSPLKNI